MCASPSPIRSRLTALEAYESIFAYRQQEYIEKQGFSGSGNLATRRRVYDSVGPFAGIELAEDRDWGHRATHKGHCITYVPGMIVFHPARRSFAEIHAKWDRHVSHDYAEIAPGWRGSFRWALRALALAASPALEAKRIVTSDRISGGRARFGAAVALTRIRLYRAKTMLGLLAKGSSRPTEHLWNR